MKKAILSSVKLNDEKNSTATQYMGCVGDIFKSDKLKKLDNFEQHTLCRFVLSVWRMANFRSLGFTSNSM